MFGGRGLEHLKIGGGGGGGGGRGWDRDGTGRGERRHNCLDSSDLVSREG